MTYLLLIDSLLVRGIWGIAFGQEPNRPCLVSIGLSRGNSPFTLAVHAFWTGDIVARSHRIIAPVVVVVVVVFSTTFSQKRL